MAIVKFWSLFKRYKKVLKENRQELEERFNIRIDYIYRMYTVFNIDAEDYKKFGESLYIESLNKYIGEVDNFLREKGLMELYGLEEKERLDELNTLLTIRFKLMDTKKLANTVRNVSIAVLMGVVGLIVFLL